MTRGLKILIGLTAVIAPALHLVSDLMEAANDGFTRPQLIVNYAAFLAMPFLFVGLYAVQRPWVHWTSLAGAIIYGYSFIYFGHTTLYALQESILNYADLWARLGPVYTIHGGLMIAGGLLFAGTSLSRGRLSRAGLVLFGVGLLVNLAIALLPLPEIAQIVGSAIRNSGLIIVGAGLIGEKPGE